MIKKLKFMLFTFIIIIFSFSLYPSDTHYPSKSLTEFYKLFKDTYSAMIEKYKDQGFIVTEAPIFMGKTEVKYLGKITKMDAKDRKVLDDWCKAHKAEDWGKLYKRKILVKEKNIEYWILMQEELIPHLKGNKNKIILLYYYYIGGYNERIIFASTGFKE